MVAWIYGESAERRLPREMQLDKSPNLSLKDERAVRPSSDALT